MNLRASDGQQSRLLRPAPARPEDVHVSQELLLFLNTCRRQNATASWAKTNLLERDAGSCSASVAGPRLASCMRGCYTQVKHSDDTDACAFKTPLQMTPGSEGVGKLAKMLSIGVLGIYAFFVEVEVHVTRATLAHATLVGLPDARGKESIERVRAALRNSGYHLPTMAATINLAPPTDAREVRLPNCPSPWACSRRLTRCILTIRAMPWSESSPWTASSWPWAPPGRQP